MPLQTHAGYISLPGGKEVREGLAKKIFSGRKIFCKISVGLWEFLCTQMQPKQI